MMPFDEIELGDVFSNPMHRGFGKYSGLLWVVTGKCITENMICVTPHSYVDGKQAGNSIWKSNTDQMFSLSWREEFPHHTKELGPTQNENE